MKNGPYFLYFLGLLFTIMTAGVVFGWTALEPVLEDSGFTQEGWFATAYTIGASANYVSGPAFGLILDHYGPRACGSVGAALFAIGVGMCSQFKTSGALLMFGYGILGFSGPGIQLSMLHLSNMFPRHRGLLLSLSTAAFDASTLVFLFFQILNERMGYDAEQLFYIMFLIPILILILLLCFWPDRSYEPEGPEVDGDDSPVKVMSFRDQVQRKEYIFIVCFATYHVVHLNFLMGSMSDQIESKYNEKDADDYTQMFSAIVPFGFVLAVPTAWYFVDKRAGGAAITVVNALAAFYGILFLFVEQPAALGFGCIAVAMSRQLTFSVFYSFIVKRFGVTNLGKLIGFSNLIASLATFSYYFWRYLGHEYDYFIPNVILFVLGLPLFASKWIVGHSATTGHVKLHADSTVDLELDGPTA
eukprot:TRINITY_DN11138_c0_g1::TRINITY_DN11138_c0_g1_i1::g.6513::m.6513 TRINITY_DN11138_c0_g1::TRINITY_DN11138_c0_g1_i1::g.6513  ORF type:complete len:416 (+),score=120.18,sp/Q04991/FMP42_YEAST/20.74/2e-19,MFS_1/PF07690.11/2.3e-18,SPW/PF03779.9/8.3e+03,SPW/PF03779.9/0.071,DUF805/PF05656.9/1.6e+03,DUF805/PF05656.9/1e+02,DUF805/PF05656.9/0.48,DUF805/PF05656.9/2.1e+03 TRINITY_DN11138_c0_g1_i1:202-1449(+)